VKRDEQQELLAMSVDHVDSYLVVRSLSLEARESVELLWVETRARGSARVLG
jgi:hypothetical protein